MFLQIILTLIIIFIIYRLTRSYLPKILINPKSPLNKIISAMQSLKKPYKPTPWLFNNHLQTIYGMRFRGKLPTPPRRETVFFSDGGQVYIDWFEKKDLKKDAPILFIVHTLGGGTREPCCNRMANYAMNEGFRVLICTCRGCNGSLITSKRLYNGYKTDDLRVIIDFARKEFSECKKYYLMGFSLGSMICAQYAMEYDDVEGVFCVSHPIETDKCVKILERPIENLLYMRVIMKSLKHLVKKSTYLTTEEKEKGLNSKTLFEFDDNITSKLIGLAGASEYYRAIRLQPKVKLFKVPTVFFNGEDDPFTRKEFIPEKEILESENCCFITTKEGGHVSFCEGMNGKSSYIEKVAIDYFRCLSKSNEN